MPRVDHITIEATLTWPEKSNTHTRKGKENGSVLSTIAVKQETTSPEPVYDDGQMFPETRYGTGVAHTGESYYVFEGRTSGREPVAQVLSYLLTFFLFSDEEEKEDE